MIPDDDPGWPRGIAMLAVFIPGGTRYFLRRQQGPANGLVILRHVFISFCGALLLFGVVLAVMWPSQSREPRSPAVAAALVAAGVLAGVIERFVEKPLDCTSDASLARSYRTRFFMRIAFAESAALLGFVGFFIASEWWVYPAGAAVAYVGFARAAPTRGHLARDQERLSGRSCGRSLVKAIAQVAPSRAR